MFPNIGECTEVILHVYNLTAASLLEFYFNTENLVLRMMKIQSFKTEQSYI